MSEPRARITAILFGLAILLLGFCGCRSQHESAQTVVVAIESSPNNLDPRIGTDAQSERIGGLIFDPLVRKDEHFEMQPWVADRWEQPDTRTWIFHLRNGIHFQDGRPLGAQDVAWTITSMLDGSIVTAKGGAFASVEKVSAPDASTLVVTLKRPDATLLFNLSDGRFGIVPVGSQRDFGQAPVGSGAFRFVSAQQDREVVLERTPAYWAEPPRLNERSSTHRIERLRFAVIPDAVTTALELKKGSADIAVNAVTLDMVHTLEQTPGLAVETGPGSPVMYLNFNVLSAPLNNRKVRQAIAFAIDRQAVIDALWRGHAQPATTLLPAGHWAAASPQELPPRSFDLLRARHLLDDAGFNPGRDGVRLRLEMKTSNDETTRLLAMILQQQLRAVGIDLTLRSSEFGTFYADVSRGAFQMYALRWIGANEDPDLYRYAFATSEFPPTGGNRSHYSNPQVDNLLSAAASTNDLHARRTAYLQVQQLLAEDLPTVPLWFPDNNIVHTRRISGITPTRSGSFDFLRTAQVR